MRPRVLAWACCTSTVALAQDLPFPPLQEKICRAGVVDKNLIAEYLLRKYPVSVLAVPPNQPITSPRHFLAFALKDPDQCKESKDKSQPKVGPSQVCAPGDRDHLQVIDSSMSHVLAGTQRPAYDPTNAIDPWEYFASADSQDAIRCGQGPKGPIEAPGARFAKPPETSDRLKSVRLRGNPDQLDVDRSNTDDFAATDKAKISYLNDTQARSKTTEILGYVGYAFQIDRNLPPKDRAEFIPYVGMHRSVVKTSPGSTDEPSTTSTYDVGALASYYHIGEFAGQPFGHQFNVRPDYLSDTEAGSRLLSLNVEYLPVKNGVINDFFPLFGSERVSAELLLAAKASTGHYVRKGDDDEAANRRDFVRLGGRVGFAVLTNATSIPIDFTTSYTSLGAVSGGPSIDYFKTGLTFSFTQDRYFGVTIGYTHGRREDTAKKEEQFSIELSGRY